LPAYLELATVAKLPDSLQRHLEDCCLKQQGWTDTQIIMSLILLNIAGGDCVTIYAFWSRMKAWSMAHSGSGEGAARLAPKVGYITSGDTLLRWQRRETITVQEPRIIGIDEFSLTKTPHINYGTLIVDEERHLPIAVLDRDEVKPIREWLKGHSGIEIITRDRYQSYTAAARSAAPEAIQVADRFHPARNASEALKTFFQSHSWKLPSPATDQPIPIQGS